jgi:hypothetical protein
MSNDANPPALTTYRRHRCHRTHHTARTFMQCAMPYARIVGEGPFAVIRRYSRGERGVWLHASLPEAQQLLDNHPYSDLVRVAVADAGVAPACRVCGKPMCAGQVDSHLSCRAGEA